MTIVPPVDRAMMNRATRNAINQGENADRIPAPACIPMAIMSGTLRPILQMKTGKHYILDCGSVLQPQHALLLQQRWRNCGS